ncbi:MAG: AraC family transcriptional regulator [Bacteroidales bacterium]|jgi:AraC-like DNA-binding protein|nr:AraC family transcriptional regulator [Bacteroidales bacterium]
MSMLNYKKTSLSFFCLFFCFNFVNVYSQKPLDKEAEEKYTQIYNCYLWYENAQFLELYPDYMDFAKKNKLWTDYFNVFNFKVQILCIERKYDEALSETEKMLPLAKELEDLFALGTIYNCFANIYDYLGRFENAESNYFQAISYFKKAKKWSSEFQAYLNLTDVMKKQGKIEEIMQLLPEFDNLYQKNIDEFDLINRFKYHCFYFELYGILEQFDKAQEYADIILEYAKELPESYFNDFQYFLARLFAAQENYSQALDVLDSLYNYEAKVGHQLNMLECLAGKVVMLAYLNRGEETVEMFGEYVSMRYEAYIEETNAQLDEIRTQYEVDRHIAEKERTRHYLLFALCGCLLLAVLLGIWIYYSRAIVRKNRGLYLQIKEQDRLAEELEVMTKQYEQMSPGKMQQRQLVARLRELLLKENYFATYNIDIQEIATALATNRTSLFEALKAVADKTPLEFINDLRLDEAKRLLESSDLTIETIAIECGFNTSRTLYRQFRERYRMSPAEYRRFTS